MLSTYECKQISTILDSKYELTDLAAEPSSQGTVILLDCVEDEAERSSSVSGELAAAGAEAIRVCSIVGSEENGVGGVCENRIASDLSGLWIRRRQRTLRMPNAEDKR